MCCSFTLHARQPQALPAAAAAQWLLLVVMAQSDPAAA
jgi:hypothetical protein